MMRVPSLSMAIMMVIYIHLFHVSGDRIVPATVGPAWEDTFIKVATQLLGSEQEISLRDQQFPSCFLGWESDADNGHFELIAGHYLIDTPFKVTDDSPPDQCMKQCKSDPDCQALNIDYERGTCEFLSSRTVRITRDIPFNGSSSPLESLPLSPSPHVAMNVSTTSRQRNLRPSPGQNYFEKVCLPHKSGLTCSDKEWAFERIIASSLMAPEVMRTFIPSAATKESCERACLTHTSPYVCRSAQFTYSTRECTISPLNRFSSPDPRIRLVPTPGTDYLENNCIHEAKGFCNTKGVKGHKQMLSERIIISNSLEECQSHCLSSESAVTFTCRSFTYESSSQTCSLSHHTTRSSSLVASPSHVYFEISSCFEVKVDCSPHEMNIHISTNLLFNGRVYVRDRPTTCYVDVSNSMNFTFPVQIDGNDCGTTREGEGDFTNVLVIQGNDQVVTAFDKAVGVRCSFDVGHKSLIGQTTLTINEMIFSSDKKIKSSAKLPLVSLHITDRNGLERDSFSLGELLKVQVRMSDESIYGIFVRNIVAKDGNDSSKLTLIDQTGCPGEGKVMREVRTIDDSGKSLESILEAFSFTGSNTLQLEAEVETCLDQCRPVHCVMPSGRSVDGYESVMSYGRRRRRRRRRSSIQYAERGDIIQVQHVVKSITINQSAPSSSSSSSPPPMIQEVPSFHPMDMMTSTSFPIIDSVMSSSTMSTHKMNESRGFKRILINNRTRSSTMNDTRIKFERKDLTTKAIGDSSSDMKMNGHEALDSPVDQSGHYCFDRVTLTAVIFLVIMVQVVMVTISFVMASRKYKMMYQDEGYYEHGHGHHYHRDLASDASSFRSTSTLYPHHHRNNSVPVRHGHGHLHGHHGHHNHHHESPISSNKRSSSMASPPASHTTIPWIPFGPHARHYHHHRSPSSPSDHLTSSPY